jgi:hypothetical protein
MPRAQRSAANAFVQRSVGKDPHTLGIVSGFWNDCAFGAKPTPTGAKNRFKKTETGAKLIAKMIPAEGTGRANGAGQTPIQSP